MLNISTYIFYLNYKTAHMKQMKDICLKSALFTLDK